MGEHAAGLVFILGECTTSGTVRNDQGRSRFRGTDLVLAGRVANSARKRAIFAIVKLTTTGPLVRYVGLEWLGESLP